MILIKLILDVVVQQKTRQTERIQEG